MICIHRELVKIMKISDEGKRRDSLEELAKRIGVSIRGFKGPGMGYWEHIDEIELVARIREVERTVNAKNVCIAAAVSAIIALLSMIAAWCAVFGK